MLLITETPAGLYKEFPDGRAASIELFDLETDVKQGHSILDSNPKLGQTFRQKLSEWLNQCAVPLENHQKDFKRLKEISTNNE